MITTQNYYTEINHIGANTLPPALLKSHELVNKITQDGTTWETYKGNDTIKRVIDLYLDKLNTFEEHQPKRPTTKTETNEPVAKKQAATKSVKPAKEKKVKAVKSKKEDTAVGVEAIEDELKFIKRFILMDGKTKSPEQVLHFLDALQKSIIERRIRKTSRYASEIKLIQ